MLFAESLSFPLPFGLLQEKGTLTLVFTKETWEQNPSRPKKEKNQRKQRILFVRFNHLDVCWLHDCRIGLFCFHFFNS